MAEMHAWVQTVVGELFDNRDGRSLGFEAALVQARKDGVSRLEIGEDVCAITLYIGSAYEFDAKSATIARPRRAGNRMDSAIGTLTKSSAGYAGTPALAISGA